MNLLDLMLAATRGATVTVDPAQLLSTMHNVQASHEKLWRENTELRKRVDELGKENDHLSRALAGRK